MLCDVFRNASIAVAEKPMYRYLERSPKQGFRIPMISYLGDTVAQKGVAPNYRDSSHDDQRKKTADRQGSMHVGCSMMMEELSTATNKFWIRFTDLGSSARLDRSYPVLPQEVRA